MIEEEITPFGQAMQLVQEHGFDGMAEAMAVLFNEAMKIERENALGARNWERNVDRRGYANGYKDKTVKTRVGEMKLNVPQVRGGVEFYPSCLEKGLRSERALNVALAEMYVGGVSTARVSRVFEEMCGMEVSSAQVSRAAARLDEELERWRSRPIEGSCDYLILDARYEKVRIDGVVRNAAVMVAIGVLSTGRRTILGISVSLSEAEVHWRQFLQSLKERGLCGLKLTISDNHEGLKKGLKATFGNVPWQRCQVHLMRNAFAYIPKKDMREEVISCIRSIFNAPNREEAERLLAMAVARYEKTASKLAKWMEENLPDGFAVFSQAKKTWKKLRTTNLLERINRELLRRTRVVGVFPNEESLLRLASALLVEMDEDWQAETKRYIGEEQD